MRRIIDIVINQFTKKHLVPPLGRWNIEYCNNKINKKIDLSNEDHCGPCGQYSDTKISKIILENEHINLQNKNIK
jgi:hypothetical protein